MLGAQHVVVAPHCCSAARSRLLQTFCRSSITVMASAPHQGEAQAPAAAHEDQLLSQFRACVPVLDGRNYKGQHGKLGVVGGCTAYTGAPFFAAQSAHKVGVDMTYVLCTPYAAPVIKGYSPDMIVLPVLLEGPEAESAQGAGDAGPSGQQPQDEGLAATGQAQQVSEAEQRLREAARTWLPRMTVVVVGPGLGEEPGPQQSASFLIRQARQAGLPIVVDGSAVTTVARDPSLVQGYDKCVLTPNMAELGRLASAVGVQLPGRIGSHWQEHVLDVAKAWQGPLLVSKGPVDRISDGRTVVECTRPGSRKRCGGIGDVLAGTLGTFLSWQLNSRHGSPAAQGEDSSSTAGAARSTTDAAMVASYAACWLVRAAAHAAFSQHGRAMGAGDIVPHLAPAFAAHLEPSIALPPPEALKATL